jgi:hypothetical protein
MSGSPHQDQVRIHLSSTNSASKTLIYASPRLLSMLPTHLGQGTIVYFSDIERKAHDNGRIYLRTRRASALRVVSLQVAHARERPTPRLLVDMYAAALLGTIDTTAIELNGNVVLITKVHHTHLSPTCKG